MMSSLSTKSYKNVIHLKCMSDRHRILLLSVKCIQCMFIVHSLIMCRLYLKYIGDDEVELYGFSDFCIL